MLKSAAEMRRPCMLNEVSYIFPAGCCHSKAVEFDVVVSHLMSALLSGWRGRRGRDTHIKGKGWMDGSLPIAGRPLDGVGCGVLDRCGRVAANKTKTNIRQQFVLNASFATDVNFFFSFSSSSFFLGSL